jgi:hypothetical protein
MEKLRTILLIIVAFILAFLLILQFILFFSYQFNTNEINELVLNWKQQPIINFFLSTENNKKDFFEIYSSNISATKIYFQRMKKKYNFPYLKGREGKIKNFLKICGSDSKNNPIYFKKNEECPINYINYTNNKLCESNEKNCLNISSSSSFRYSNHNIN